MTLDVVAFDTHDMSLDLPFPSGPSENHWMSGGAGSAAGAAGIAAAGGDAAGGAAAGGAAAAGEAAAGARAVRKNLVLISNYTQGY